jgi:hypothetical protein
MRRRLFNLAAAVSLLMGVATVVFWMRSYWVCDALGGTMPHSFWSTNVSRGRILLQWEGSQQFLGLSLYNAGGRDPETIQTYGTFVSLGFYYDGRMGANGASRCAMVFPIWLAFLPTGLFAGYLILKRNLRRSQHGACFVCDYNLTENVSGVCPECGTPIKSKPVLISKS